MKPPWTNEKLIVPAIHRSVEFFVFLAIKFISYTVDP